MLYLLYFQVSISHYNNLKGDDANNIKVVFKIKGQSNAASECYICRRDPNKSVVVLTVWALLILPVVPKCRRFG